MPFLQIYVNVSWFRVTNTEPFCRYWGGKSTQLEGNSKTRVYISVLVIVLLCFKYDENMCDGCRFYNFLNSQLLLQFTTKGKYSRHNLQTLCKLVVVIYACFMLLLFFYFLVSLFTFFNLQYTQAIVHSCDHLDVNTRIKTSRVN